MLRKRRLADDLRGHSAQWVPALADRRLGALFTFAGLLIRIISV